MLGGWRSFFFTLSSLGKSLGFLKVKKEPHSKDLGAPDFLWGMEAPVCQSGEGCLGQSWADFCRRC
jgi:hypothetical protein